MREHVFLYVHLDQTSMSAGAPQPSQVKADGIALHFWIVWSISRLRSAVGQDPYPGAGHRTGAPRAAGLARERQGRRDRETGLRDWSRRGSRQIGREASKAACAAHVAPAKRGVSMGLTPRNCGGQRARPPALKRQLPQGAWVPIAARGALYDCHARGWSVRCRNP